MNISGTITCLNCGETMQQGGTEIGPYGMTQLRYCECGLRMFLFNKVEGFEYSLQRKRTDDEGDKDKVQEIGAQLGRLLQQKFKQLTEEEKALFLKNLKGD